MKLLPKVLLILLSIVTGGLFIYSAIMKMDAPLSFEYTIIENLHLSASAARVLGRFLTALEMALGALMVLQLYGKSKWPLKAAFALTAIFTLYLAILWAIMGDNVNCGCFGDAVWMRPSVSMGKNILLMAAIWLLIRYHRGFTLRWLPPVAFTVAIITTIVISFFTDPAFSRYKIDLNTLYTADKRFIPSVNLKSGKHIIAFLSPTCSHCIKAAGIMSRIQQQNPTIPFFLIIGGTESDLTNFWAESKATNIPYTRLGGEATIKYTGGAFPQIFLVKDSWVVEKLEYHSMNQQTLEKWLKYGE